MREMKKAVVVLCRCGEVHKTYGIRAEESDANGWCFTWAFPIKESAAKREGYDKTSVGGNLLLSEDYPGCPYCRQKSFVVCSCGHISCKVLKKDRFTCEWCGESAELTEYSGERIQAGGDV